MDSQFVHHGPNPTPEAAPRAKDGSHHTIYRCQHPYIKGISDGKGVYIAADVLDFAVLQTLDQQINNGYFLERLFAAWDSDAEAAMGHVRSIEQTLHETQELIANLAARIAHYWIDDPAAAPLEVHLRQLQETIPGLEQRQKQAVAAVDRARANPTLRAELAKWFDAWLGGVWLMSTAMQREFLMALNARVRVWRPQDRSPRALLVIALPTSAALLPMSAQADTVIESDGMHLEVDVKEAERLTAAARGWTAVGTEGAEGAEAGTGATTADNAEELMARILAELTEQGYGVDVARRIAPYFVSSPSRRQDMAYPTSYTPASRAPSPELPPAPVRRE